jgi:hypothetical protein
LSLHRLPFVAAMEGDLLGHGIAVLGGYRTNNGYDRCKAQIAAFSQRSLILRPQSSVATPPSRQRDDQRASHPSFLGVNRKKSMQRFRSHDDVASEMFHALQICGGTDAKTSYVAGQQ